MANKVMNLRMTPTKQSLIEAFMQLVSRKDFEKITIADITQGARVNRATFYAHFTDKYELLDHIMGDSAAVAIANRFGEKRDFALTHAGIQQLVLGLLSAAGCAVPQQLCWAGCAAAEDQNVKRTQGMPAKRAG